jgi:hypothetical protein
VVPCDTLG